MSTTPAPSASSASAELRKPPYLLVVVPCYNEEEVLHSSAGILHEQVATLVDNGDVAANSGILFVDDGSKDSTWRIIEELHEQDGTMFHGVKLAHNKGHQNALLAGMTYAYDTGVDAIISLDADLQDDPNAITTMVNDYRSGAEIVYGVRDNRDTDTAFKRGTAVMFYKVMNALGTETIPNHADYRLLSRKALAALMQYQEENLFLRGIVPSIGLPSSKVYYKRGERQAGESKYPLHKMVSFAVEGITSFSVRPLSIITGLGIVSIIVSIAMLIYTLVSVGNGHAVAGWGSLMCSLWLIGGLILISLGVIGEYIAKIYIEAKHRPRFIIEQAI
ncbi:glycosyltransferase family 2 protein [Bifidobacterium gallicum]|uniref:Glycosyltransferase n=1 Tax=Bifidobacterium gallicum DSM 20093 = LMG 11596 TaxID=561180 RepID=D1NVS1_9BIFI|nr:glycosyltransferase family 2 protein [Bifidobacterium gallicum]EFA22922.1 glycosyltransferase, group 2 family protein [Bifidobacterium gallicum DSM 20093 = LMG 11596]KFI59381.1 glycosyltransferase [Bifidobacterium gallicum DSM 20093 = LMG 11596]